MKNISQNGEYQETFVQNPIYNNGNDSGNNKMNMNNMNNMINMNNMNNRDNMYNMNINSMNNMNINSMNNMNMNMNNNNMINMHNMMPPPVKNQMGNNFQGTLNQSLGLSLNDEQMEKIINDILIPYENKIKYLEEQLKEKDREISSLKMKLSFIRYAGN